MEAAAHEGYLSLVRWQGRDHLFHVLTTELVEVPPDFQGCTLRFRAGQGSQAKTDRRGYGGWG